MNIFRNVSIPQSLYFYIVLLILIYQNNYLEDSESVLSAFIAHEYYPISNDYAYLDLNLLLIPIISFINKFIPGIQLYGLYILSITLISGWVFLKLIEEITIKEKLKSIQLQILFIILYTPNIIILSTTRVAIILFISFLIAYHYKLYSKKLLSLSFVFCFMLRLDIILILSALYLAFNIIRNSKFQLRDFLPFAFALLLFILYHIFISKYASDPYKAFYYYELDFVDRDNINYTSLDAKQKIIVSLGKKGIIDEQLFETKFLDNILLSKSSFLTNVITYPKLLLNVFINSLDSIIQNIFLIICCLIYTIIFIIRKHLREKLLSIFLFIFPLIICFYISLPNRFIFPYYTLLFLYSYSIIINKTHWKILFTTIAILISIIESNRAISLFERSESAFYETIEKIKSVEKQCDKPLVFENAFYRKFSFFNPNIFYKYKNQQIQFLNLAFFQSFNNYTFYWQNIGCKRPLSLLDKINTINNTHQPIIFDSEETYNTYLKYLKEMHSLDLKFKNIIIK